MKVPKRCFGIASCAIGLVVLAVLVWFAHRFIISVNSDSLSARLMLWMSWAKELLTILAVIVGGIWAYLLFIRTRQKYPRLNLQTVVTVMRYSDSERLLRLGLKLENVGSVLAKLRMTDVYVQQLKPWPHAVLEEIRHMDSTAAETGEGNWPLICERKLTFDKGKKEIEPGEKDEIWLDFIIEGDVEAGLVYAHVQNESKKRHRLLWRRQIGWNTTVTFTVQDDGRRGNDAQEDNLNATDGQEAGKETGAT